VTVTGTENLMMAAALAKGSTTLENAACEPEVEELARVLNKMGAHIRGAGTSLITVEGVDELHPIDHAIIPYRIEAGTLMVAAAITRGNVLIRDCMPSTWTRSSPSCARPASRSASKKAACVWSGAVTSTHRHRTRPHPGFPTDMQAQFMVLMSRPRGSRALGEHLRESLHARARADAHGRGHRDRRAPRRGAGSGQAQGRQGHGTDLRASACLVLADWLPREPRRFCASIISTRLRSPGTQAARLGATSVASRANYERRRDRMSEVGLCPTELIAGDRKNPPGFFRNEELCANGHSRLT